MSNYPNNNKKSDIPWWAVVACFVFGLWPIGLVLLVVKLGQESGAFSSRSGRQNYDRFAQEARRGAEEARRAAGEAAQAAREAADRARQSARSYQQAQNSAAQTQAQRDEATREAYRQAQEKFAAQQKYAATKKPSDKKVEPDAADTSAKKVSRKNPGKIKTGKLFTILGAVLMAVFGFATIMTFAENLSFLTYEPLWLLEEVLPPFICTGVGAGMFTWGRFKKGQSKRFKRYLSLIGDQDQVSISALAAAYPAKRDACCTTLENMIEAGVLGENAYLDYGRDLLVLDGSGVRAEEPRAKVAPETDLGEENAWLRQIREVNAAIANPELSRKIDRIGEITERILEFQKEHPEKSAELRKFLNYYLPTTLKILSSYAELEKQGVEGENIAATKQRIEGMMDMVVEGFERQLDKLFAGDMMDIAADITVMEQMMQGDGLFNKDGSGMGSGSGAGSGGGAGMGGH